MLALNIAVGGTIVFTLLALFAKQRQDALTALQIAQDQAENLLLNVLPRPIAERLKAEPQTIADQFTSASILFADVVDFTPRSEHLSPAEVVGILDHLFSHFDMLAERYDGREDQDHRRLLHGRRGRPITAAGSCPRAGADGARHGRRHALERRRWGTSVWRCGWGSIPARWWRASSAESASCTTCGAMPSTPPAGWNRQGTPGRIQITRATHDLIEDEFVCEPRGTIPVKGKGEMETWYLLGRRTTAAVDGVGGGAPLVETPR